MVNAESTTALARRAGWVALTGIWVFLLVALISYDAADWPSHVVAVHNDPVSNLCGRVGAGTAYWCYQMLGSGLWLLIAGGAATLALTVVGERLDHPVVRIVGLLLMTIAVSGLHGILLPDLGSMVGINAGLFATALVNELLPRFSTFGSVLLFAAAFTIGALVAIDEVVLALPRLAIRGIAQLSERGAPLVAFVTNLRPGAANAEAEEEEEEESEEEEDDEEYEYEDEDEDAEDEEYEDEEEEDDDEEYEYEDDDEEEEEEEEEEDTNVPVVVTTPAARESLTRDELRQKIAKLPIKMASRQTQVARDEDIPRTDDFKDYKFPTLDLLKDPQANYTEQIENLVREQAQHLEEALQTYGIDAEVVGIESGPAVTLYSVQLAPGTKVSKVSAVSSDIARSLRTQNIRIVANMVGRTAIGIEVPNPKREKVRLKELMSGGEAEGMILPMFLGKDAAGEPLVADLTKMPHMLIAGTTGSGKSICMNTILMSWLYTKRPDELKLILVDPKMVEMSQFRDIPHLICPVVTEAARAAAIMEWAVERMEERYELLKEAEVQNIGAYNKLTEEELYETMGAETDEEKARIPRKLHYMVFVVDELADMMMTCKEVEHSIVRIAQKARAVGIHLILATQRPQANVVTGLIKANMPCRVSFKVASGMDSRIVLDSKGAELLLGQGDMMFLTPHTSEIRRAQGTLVEDVEIRKVTRFVREVAGPSFDRSLVSLRTANVNDNDPNELKSAERDPMFDQAVEIMIESGRGSVSLLQRRMSIGYSRASRLVDQMGLAGILGDHKGSVAREVLVTIDEWRQMVEMRDQAEADGTVFETEEEAATETETV